MSGTCSGYWPGVIFNTVDILLVNTTSLSSQMLAKRLAIGPPSHAFPLQFFLNHLFIFWVELDIYEFKLFALSLKKDYFNNDSP